MSTEPIHLRNMDRAVGRFIRYREEMVRAVYRAGYEEGRKDQKAGLPNRFIKKRIDE